MTEVSIRELRKHGGDVIDRVARGEHVTITRAGKPVAELRPLGRGPLTLGLVIEAWRLLPRMDPHQFRADLDSVIDGQL